MLVADVEMSGDAAMVCRLVVGSATKFVEHRDCQLSWLVGAYAVVCCAPW